DEARHCGPRAVRKLAQLRGVEQAETLEMRTDQGERMTPEREPEARVICDDVRAFARRRQPGKCFLRREIQGRTARRTSGRPVGKAAVPGERVQRAGRGERTQVLAIEAELVNRHIRLSLSKLFACRLRQAADYAQAQAQGRAFERAVPLADVDIRRPDLDAVAARVL